MKNMNNLFLIKDKQKQKDFIYKNLVEQKGFYDSFYVETDDRLFADKCCQQLMERGYIVKILDFSDEGFSNCFNPFYYIRSDEDIMELSAMIAEEEAFETQSRQSSVRQTFWYNNDRMLLNALIAYLYHYGKPYERTLSNIMRLIRAANVDENDSSTESPLDNFFKWVEKEDSESFAWTQYSSFRQASYGTRTSTIATVLGILQDFNSKTIKDLTDTDNLGLDFLLRNKYALFLIMNNSNNNVLCRLVRWCVAKSLLNESVKLKKDSAISSVHYYVAMIGKSKTVYREEGEVKHRKPTVNEVSKSFGLKAREVIIDGRRVPVDCAMNNGTKARSKAIGFFDYSGEFAVDAMLNVRLFVNADCDAGYMGKPLSVLGRARYMLQNKIECNVVSGSKSLLSGMTECYPELRNEKIKTIFMIHNISAPRTMRWFSSLERSIDEVVSEFFGIETFGEIKKVSSKEFEEMLAAESLDDKLRREERKTEDELKHEEHKKSSEDNKGNNTEESEQEAGRYKIEVMTGGAGLFFDEKDKKYRDKNDVNTTTKWANTIDGVIELFEEWYVKEKEKLSLHIELEDVCTALKEDGVYSYKCYYSSEFTVKVTVTDTCPEYSVFASPINKSLALPDEEDENSDEMPDRKVKNGEIIELYLGNSEDKAISALLKQRYDLRDEEVGRVLGAIDSERIKEDLNAGIDYVVRDEDKNEILTIHVNKYPEDKAKQEEIANVTENNKNSEDNGKDMIKTPLVSAEELKAVEAYWKETGSL